MKQVRQILPLLKNFIKMIQPTDGVDVVGIHLKNTAQSFDSLFRLTKFFLKNGRLVFGHYDDRRGIT